MTKVVIQNLNTNINRRLRFIGVNGATIELDPQTGAVLLYGADLRVCLAPFQGLSCVGATPTTNVVEMVGTFDLDINGTVYSNLTPEALVTLLERQEISVEGIIDPTPYNLTVEYL